MSLVASMDGTKCKEVHLPYMDMMEAFFIHVLILFDIGLFRLLLPLPV